MFPLENEVHKRSFNASQVLQYNIKLCKLEGKVWVLLKSLLFAASETVRTLHGKCSLNSYLHILKQTFELYFEIDAYQLAFIPGQEHFKTILIWIFAYTLAETIRKTFATNATYTPRLLHMS